MRLFIAVLFQEDVKEKLYKIVERLGDEMTAGNLTKKENLHLTVTFIGETNRVAAVKEAMDAVNADTFTLQLQSLGSFRRNSGDIYWIGVQKNETLSSIYQQLYEQLDKRSFSLENRTFRPHLTLGRQMIFSKDFSSRSVAVPMLCQQVCEIVLMKSERIRGKLTYTPLYRRKLG